MKKEQHWTERSTEDFVHRLTFDFVRQVEQTIEDEDSSQADLANRLGVTEGRVSQVLNNPSPMTLRNVVKYARAIGRKVALVLYDDGDPTNSKGPVNAEIFSRCWEIAGRPEDFFELESAATTTTIVVSPQLVESTWHYHRLTGPNRSPDTAILYDAIWQTPLESEAATSEVVH